ncbi:MAG: hydrogenase nickel incorporation protein HypB [Caulobacteraceae bacterium]
MCGTCGCGGDDGAVLTDTRTGARTPIGEHAHGHGHSHENEHVHADGTRHTHGAHDHAHTHEPAAPNLVELNARILAKNNALAERNRAWFAGREILAVNLMSAPGAGKTTLLERAIADLKAETPLFVLEGDQATANDARRIEAAGAAAVQINTGSGCHLDAAMVARGLAELKPPVGALVMIENVGNLVCPSLFDLGEKRRIAILSVTEGDDKPLKYPHMFQRADLMLLNKIDLLPHVDFDVPRATANARAVNPDIAVLSVSARTGEGLDAWYDWLRGEHSAVKESVLA